MLPPDQLVALFVDIVSKNGNLLLNIGPKPDGTISDIQLDRLHKLGEWLNVNGEALFNSRPWVRASATTPEGADMRFTSKGEALYTVFLHPVAGKDLKIPSVRAVEGTTAQILGSTAKATATHKGNDLMITAEGATPQSYAVTVKLSPAPISLA